MSEYKAPHATAAANVKAAANPPQNPSVEVLGNALKEVLPEKEKEVVSEQDTTVVGKTIEPKNLEDFDTNDLNALEFLEAKPLGFGEFLNIVPIDKKYYYRWVNRNSQRQAMARAQGFRNATGADVKVADEAKQADGTIGFDDVVLMKLPKLNYFQAQKYSIEKAVKLSNKEDVDRTNLGMANQEINKVKGPRAEVAQKVAAYVPKSVGQ